jgi:hypothetical protein
MGERGGAEDARDDHLRGGIAGRCRSHLAGTDDGNVQVTRDGGKTWTNVRPNIPRTLVPEGTWVSRVEPSHFEPGTAYVVRSNGHRRMDMKRTS